MNQHLLHFESLSIFYDTSKGTLHYKILLQPKLFIDPSGKHDFIFAIPVNAIWAGCSKTRKSTSSVLTLFLGAPVHFSSKTQSMIAFRSRRSTPHSFISHRSRTSKDRHLGHLNRLFERKEHCKAAWNFTQDT